MSAIFSSSASVAKRALRAARRSPLSKTASKTSMLRRPPRDKPASRTAAATAKPAASASPSPQPLHVLCAVALLLAALAYRPTLEERHSAAAAPEAAFDTARASTVMIDLCRLGPRPAGEGTGAWSR